MPPHSELLPALRGVEGTREGAQLPADTVSINLPGRSAVSCPVKAKLQERYQSHQSSQDCKKQMVFIRVDTAIL